MGSPVAKPNCDEVRQCLRAERAWPPGMEGCPKILVPETVRSRAKDGKWGYSMDFGECSQDSIISPQFDVAEKFGYNGLAKVSRNGKWGYINLKGEGIIPLHFDEVGDFDSGLVPVKLNNKWGYFNAQGDNAVPPFFDAVSGVWRNELSAVLLQGKWGYVNPRGDTVIKPSFDKVTEFRDGLAKVEVNQRWGVIDTTGATVIEPAFDAIFSIADPRLLLVALNRKYGYFDNKGKEVIPLRLVKPVKARYDSGGIQVVLNATTLTQLGDTAAATAASVPINAWYFLDSVNEKLRFDENGKAQLWRNGEWFYVNPKGMLVK
ncbi:MAG: WG repeat-containing protein [Betaproteobacteria bacterium]|nr:WG repeat-containing protein [Betaproteobacteria bacterium]